MRQSIHIFKKDVRQFWKEIAVVVASTSLFIALGLRRTQPQYSEMAWSFSILLLPITWWLLISRVIHAEPLPGTRPFWMTRPYSWRSLLSAKALFILIFINIPLFIADTVVLQRFGFHFSGVLAGLMLKQAMITVAFLIPSAVLAALTTGLVQVLLALVAFAVVYIILIMSANSGGPLPQAFFGMPFFAFDWLRWLFCALLVAIAGLVIIVLQYWKRRTWLSATLALLCLSGVGFLTVLTPWLWILDLQSRLSKQHIPTSGVTLRLNSALTSRALFLKGDRVEIDVPLEISPLNLSARIDTLVFSIRASDGARFDFSSFQSESTQSEPTKKLHAAVPGPFYRNIRNESLRIQGRAYLTLFAPPTLTTILPSQKQVTIPGGRCSVDSSEDGRTYFLECISPLRSDRELRTVRMQVAVDGQTAYLVPANQYHPISYSLLPADFGLDPVTRRQYMAAYLPPFWKRQSETAQPSLKAVEVITSEPTAHLWTDFKIMVPRLSDHEVNMLH